MGEIPDPFGEPRRDRGVFGLPADRRPNPHVAFGFGVHLCLGAAHARTVLRTLLDVLCRRVGWIELVAKQERVEHTAAYDRPVGYESLTVRFQRR